MGGSVKGRMGGEEGQLLGEKGKGQRTPVLALAPQTTAPCGTAGSAAFVLCSSAFRTS